MVLHGSDVGRISCTNQSRLSARALGLLRWIEVRKSERVYFPEFKVWFRRSSGAVPWQKKPFSRSQDAEHVEGQGVG